MTDQEFLEAAQFLPNLPKSNLDDRTFEDLVQECLLRIPRYCPEWTNYNPGDPGVTLIELFSWLVHQMLFRFNQVPRRNYVAFLELLGIRLQPPTPALTELTFYLTKEQSVAIHILAGTEVATVRTENQPAIVFSTQEDLTIARPRIRHILQGETSPNFDPGALLFDNPFADTVYEQAAAGELPLPSNSIGQWRALDRDFPLFENCQPENCVYFVLGAESVDPLAPNRDHNGGASLVQGLSGQPQPVQATAPITNGLTANGSANNGSANNGSTANGTTANNAVPFHAANGSARNEPPRTGLEGTVLAFTFRGPKAVTTGINPLHPPLRWEAWNGERWVTGILREGVDDHTKGFSFDKLSLEVGPNPEREGADVLLHLPQAWPQVTSAAGYCGHWIRCVYVEANVEQQQFPYQRSPMISGVDIRALGGTVNASECIQITDEFLGVSDGKPGQVFQLESYPVLERSLQEHLEVRLPSGELQAWQEASDFGDASQSDRIYTIDDSSGAVQFGPLIREPFQVQQQTHERGQVQSWGRSRSRDFSTANLPALPAVLEDEDRRNERQYGAVPPMGAEIYMRRYRTGGGSRGNVREHSLTVLKTAIPYVRQVINYVPAQGGSDAESLDQAVLRAPAILRSRQVAITPEDFEFTAKRFRDKRFIYRAHCITDPTLTTPGQVRLMVIPGLEEHDLDLARGIHPEQLKLNGPLHEKLLSHLDQHRTLGIQVKVETPLYVGIQVQAQVYLQPQYSQGYDPQTLNQRLQTVLNTFLNPLTGGFEKTGWPLGRPVRTSDIIALLQDQPEVRYIGNVGLYSLRHYTQGAEQVWIKAAMPAEEVTLSALETLCSWADELGPEDLRANTSGVTSPAVQLAPLATHQLTLMG
ncbi:MAG: putative baseplate assembly protein [Cyanobacteria bacterium J06598_3]